ncbi:hypothetical protein ACS0TY_024213 [Phlomoides rotata]
MFSGYLSAPIFSLNPETHKTDFTKGCLLFLPSNCKKEVKDRRGSRKQSIVLSMSTSGIKGDGLTYKDPELLVIFCHFFLKSVK